MVFFNTGRAFLICKIIDIWLLFNFKIDVLLLYLTIFRKIRFNSSHPILPSRG